VFEKKFEPLLTSEREIFFLIPLFTVLH